MRIFLWYSCVKGLYKYEFDLCMWYSETIRWFCFGFLLFFQPFFTASHINNFFSFSLWMTVQAIPHTYNQCFSSVLSYANDIFILLIFSNNLCSIFFCFVYSYLFLKYFFLYFRFPEILFFLFFFKLFSELTIQLIIL